jgi:hypothetical protein
MLRASRHLAIIRAGPAIAPDGIVTPNYQFMDNGIWSALARVQARKK